jgi:catechol 2,3-dioxygenase-like lactoylglutathione lyase family enzyme
MKIEKISIMIMVQDMDRAMRFYCDRLGMNVERETEDWAIFREGIGLMLAPDPLPADELRMNSIWMNISVSNIESSYHELTGKGIAFLFAPEDVGNAKVAAFRDSEGNFLQLIEEY